MNTPKITKAYISVLTNRDYLYGLVVLKHSLELTQPKYPFYALVPSNISEDILEELKEFGVDTLFAENFDDSIICRENKVEYWKETLFKLKVFDLVDFEKIVFLDSDMIVFNNIDHLFAHPHISCVAAGQELHSDWIDLNSGLMVIQPNHEEYLAMIDIIDQVYEIRTQAGRGIGDQDVIEKYYTHWKATPELHLGSEYNTMLGYAGYLRKAGIINRLNDIYVYHYTGKQKPWRGKLSEDVAILSKIMKRSKSLLDFQAFFRYKSLLKRCIKK